jgi:adenylate kinase family enzyme
MVIGIFGESCAGKSTIAEALSKKIEVKIHTGKNYMKLAKNEADAIKLFRDELNIKATTTDTIIYVISEKEHLQFLPKESIRILVTAELDIIKERFSKRMNGNLPPPVEAMLEMKHGMFDNEEYDLLVNNVNESISDICENIIRMLAQPG